MNYEEQWERLNEYQRAAVLDESPACVVNANVGSGKTTVLIAKILYLHVKKQVPIRDMTVLTFTNKAAGEIKERLLAIEPELTEEELAGFGTFHSVAMNFLRTRLDIESMGWSKDFMIIEPDEETELALRLAKEKKLKIKYKNRLKRRLEQEYAAFRQGKEKSRYEDDLFLLFEALREEKKRQDKMSFSDLIEICTELLNRADAAGENTAGEKAGRADEKQSDTAPGYTKPAWIIVDEVQDSDRAQVEFITALKGAHTRLFAVGDPNQLIYSWRGSVETMFYYLKHQFQAKELSLPVNYRSSRTILEAAGRFLQYGNAVTGSKEEGTLIQVRNHYDAFGKAQYLADRIRTLHQNGLEYGEIAVFYRLQSQSEILEKVFEKEKIPYTVSLKKTLRDIPVLDWFVKVLTFACNPNDRYAAEAVLSHPVYGERMEKKKLKSFLTEPKAGTSLIYDRMKGFMEAFSFHNIECLALENGDGLKEWDEKSSSTTSSTKQYNAEMKCDESRLYQYFSLDDYLRPNTAAYEEEYKLVMDLCKRLELYSRENQKCLAQGTAQFLRSSALYGIQILKEEENPAKDKVRFMTLHASKGLEFTYVFIIGVNDGLIPLTGKSFEQEEEERRLFFVGMTRAREQLELSYYTNPGQPRVNGGPGRYLNMLPKHLVDWEGNQTQEEKQANLQQLRKAVRREQELLANEEKKIRKARHPKYGTGNLVDENEMTVTVEFEGYGRKEFLKAFGEIEIL